MEQSPNGGGRVGAFVREDFIRELKTPPFFWIGPELARRVACGESPLLTDSQVCAANTHGGLNLVLWHVCVTPEDAKRADVRNQVSAGFFESFRGYLLKEMIALQATFVEEAGWIADGGGLFLSSRNGEYVR